MHQIRPWLYIGTRKDSLNPGLLHAHGITAMLQLAKDIKHPGIRSKFLRVEDAEILPPWHLKEGVAYIIEEQTQGGTVLIACIAGISRSVTFTVAVLRELEGLSLSDALEDIKQHHPEAKPHSLTWESLCDYYREAGPSRARSGKRRNRGKKW